MPEPSPSQRRQPGSWTIGQIAGIQVRIHWTFLLLVVWFAGGAILSGAGVASALSAVALLFSVFACVVLHELGHGLTARLYGIQTRDITLYPIGGIARLERMPTNPRQEFVVALAGPAVSLALGLGLGALVGATGGVEVHGATGLLPTLASINLALGIFNLIPAFPMDGGRVLRAWLATRMDPVQATRVAAGIGRALAVGLGLLGLFSNWVLVLIAVFIYLSAGAEAHASEVRAGVAGARVSDAMLHRVVTLPANAPLAEAAELLLDTEQVDFPVVDHGVFVGMLTRPQLLEGLSRGLEGRAVGGLVDSDAPVLSPDLALEDALPQLQETGGASIAVVSADGSLVGLLTAQNLAEWLAVRGALERGGRHASA